MGSSRRAVEAVRLTPLDAVDVKGGKMLLAEGILS